MTEPRTFADAILSNKRRTTRREQFLTEMDQVIPWATLEALVEPHYPKAGRGRRPLPMATMLRIYFLQQWFNLSDPQAEDMLYDSESMRRFARIDLLTRCPTRPRSANSATCWRRISSPRGCSTR